MGDHSEYQYFQYIDGTARPYIKGKNQVTETYEDVEPRMHHYVMWSGGTDSTLLLYELLDTYGAEYVHAISYNYPWLYEDKYQSEKVYREKFIEKMKTKGSRYYPFSYNEFNTTVESYVGDNIHPLYGNRPSYPQAVAWLLSVGPYIPDRSYIYTGAILDDDLSFRREYYREMFTGMCGVLGKYLMLREPYALLKKHEILDKLIEYDLYDCTWFCELPPNGPETKCCKCNPCLLHMRSLSALDNGYTKFKVSEDVRMKASSELKKMEKEKAKRSKKSLLIDKSSESKLDDSIKDDAMKVLNYIKDCYNNDCFIKMDDIDQYLMIKPINEVLINQNTKCLCIRGINLNKIIENIVPNRPVVDIINELKVIGALHAPSKGKNTIKLNGKNHSARFYAFKLSFLESK